MEFPAFEDMFKQIKLNFLIIGIPFDDKLQKFKFTLFVFMIVHMVFEEIAYVVTEYAPETFLDLTQLAPCICCGLLSALKIVAIAFKRQKIFELTKCLNGLYDNFLSKPKWKPIVKREIILVNILMKYFFILNMILISFYNFSSLIFMIYRFVKTSTVEYHLPYPLFLPFSTDSWMPWTFVYVKSVVCGFICVLFYATVDILYCVMTSQICCNLSIISSEIETLDETNVGLLKEIVTNHQYVLKLSEDLEGIFKLPNLINVMVGSLEICALGVNITMGDWAHFPGCILFLISVLLQILMMSVFGENLIGESRKVGDAAFCCKWYDMDRKSKSIIFMIMTRSQKPQQLTAYNFSVICYESFTKIISTSWSYFTILRTVYTPPEMSQLE